MEEGRHIVGVAPDARSQPPTISLVMPCFNQRRFVEEAVHSVLQQSYPRLEFVVMDGGSTDGSEAILKEYERCFHSFVSQRDNGQYDAINRGFLRTTGDVMGWLNSDDRLAPDALKTVAGVFQQFPDVQWISSLCPRLLDQNGRRRWCRKLPGYSMRRFWRGEYVVGLNRFWSGWIPQESTFWRRSLWERAGGRIGNGLGLAADFDLWVRFAKHADLVGVAAAIGEFRRYPTQRSIKHRREYIEEARSVFSTNGGVPNPWHLALARKIVTRLPSNLRRRAAFLGLTDRTTVLVKKSNESRWQLSHSFA